MSRVKVDPRFTKASGVEVFTGSELLVKGCLETEGGTHLWTGYPGSPVAGFFDTARQLGDLLKTHGIRAAMANNEALGAAMVNGYRCPRARRISDPLVPAIVFEGPDALSGLFIKAQNPLDLLWLSDAIRNINTPVLDSGSAVTGPYFCTPENGI